MLVIAALVAIAILGTILLTRGSGSATSQEDQVRTAIEQFDVAIQSGDLATLRSITCGAKRDSYVSYDDKAWEETYKRVAAAKQYPVVASIDQIVVNGDHAEANVTAFMAYAPQTRAAARGPVRSRLRSRLLSRPGGFVVRTKSSTAS